MEPSPTENRAWPVVGTVRRAGEITSQLVNLNRRLKYWLPYLLSKLQNVRNNAARLIFRTPRAAHATPMLHSLHWLPVEQRIEYKSSLLSFKIISQAPIYLRTSSLLHSFPAALLYYRHPSVQNTILPNKVQWSALFLLPGFSCLEPASCVCIRRVTSVSSFKSSLKTSFHPPPPFLQSHCHEIRVCVCVCVRACVRVCMYALNLENMYI